MLDVRRMRVLREVAAKGSFSAAADALNYTQSAVSQQIAALEREAGTRLVERSARGVRLTDGGRIVVEHAEAILARLADAEAALDALSGLKGGRVRLASFPSAGATLMPEAIARFRAQHPSIELTMTPAEPDEAASLLKAGEVDIALIIATARGEDVPMYQGLQLTHLLDDPMYIALPAGHPLAHKRCLRLEDLAHEPFMLGSSGTCPDTSIFLRECGKAGFEPEVSFHTDDYTAIQGFVAAGLGVSFIPDLALYGVRDDIVVRSLGRGAPVRRIHAAVLEGSWCSPARSAMLEVLAEVGESFAGARQELALAS
jgi:DNA-binding transcriptional LysR family regulator